MGMSLTESNVLKFLKKINRLKLVPYQRSQLHELMEKPIFFMKNDLFNSTAAVRELMETEVVPETAFSLTPEQLRISFLQLNYTRCLMAKQRRKLLRAPAHHREDILKLLRLHQQNLAIRERIIAGNMRLVLAMAKRANYPNIEVTDLISEGSMALLRAMEKFDVARGFSFSTYACRAILRSFLRVARKTYRYHGLFPSQFDPALEKDDHLNLEREKIHNDTIQDVRHIVDQNLARLSAIEQSVVDMRFCLSHKEEGPLTLQEVGQRLGLSKERIRQIQGKALSKIRLVVQDTFVQV